MSTTNWCDFKNDVRNVLNPPGFPDAGDQVSTPVPPWRTPPTIVVSKSNIWFLALIVLAVSLGVLIIFSKPTTQLDTSAFKQVETQSVAPNEMQAIRQDVERLKIKTRILGAVSNNNWSGYNARQPSQDIVYIGKDWKMSQIPQNLQKTEADAKFLQEWCQ